MDWKNSRIDALLERALDRRQGRRRHHDQSHHRPRPARHGSIVARQEMVVCGLGAVPRFLEIFARLDRRAPAQTRFEVVSHPEIFDGVRVHDGQVLAVIRHNARVLLSCERVILNLMQHLSGIATLTRQFVDAIHGTGTRSPGHAQDGAGPAGAGKIRRAVRRGNQSPARPGQRHSHQEQPHLAGRRAARGAFARALENRQKGQRVQVEVRTRAGAGRGARIRRGGDSAGQYDARSR